MLKIFHCDVGDIGRVCKDSSLWSLVGLKLLSIIWSIPLQ